MLLEPITVNVDPEVATFYRSATEDERQKLDLLVSLRLRDATRLKQSLKQIAAEVSQKAQQRGLTPEILQGILDER